MEADDARSALKRFFANAPDQVADGLAKVVRTAPDERIAKFMSTPARRVVLEGIFWQMPQHFDRTRAGGIEATIRWCVTGRADGGADTYELRIADGNCRVSHGSNGTEPRLTITLDGVELVKLATGNSDPVQAYFSRRVRLAGDLMLAAKLGILFRIPRRPG
jgi:hypothetical protein